MVAGEISLIFTAYPQNLLWWAEIIIGVISPIILFSLPELRQNRNAVFWTSVLVIVGLVINRFNASLLALDMRPGYSYFPHWMEFAISTGLVADALLVIWLAHRFLPIAHHEESISEKVT
jgi:Ni/Fe-hydrogenase subunit HybB-like protein